MAAALIPPQDLSLDLDEDLFVEDIELDFTSMPNSPGEFEEEYKYLKENVYSKLPGLKTKQSTDTEKNDSTGSEHDKEKKLS